MAKTKSKELKKEIQNWMDNCEALALSESVRISKTELFLRCPVTFTSMDFSQVPPFHLVSQDPLFSFEDDSKWSNECLFIEGYVSVLVSLPTFTVTNVLSLQIGIIREDHGNKDLRWLCFDDDFARSQACTEGNQDWIENDPDVKNVLMKCAQSEMAYIVDDLNRIATTELRQEVIDAIFERFGLKHGKDLCQKLSVA